MNHVSACNELHCLTRAEGHISEFFSMSPDKCVGNCWNESTATAICLQMLAKLTAPFCWQAAVPNRKEMGLMSLRVFGHYFQKKSKHTRRLAWRFSLSSFQATSLGRIFTSRSFAPDWGCQAWFELWLCPCIHLSARIWLMHTAADGFTVPINFMNTLIHCSFLGGRKTGTNKDAVGRVCSNTCN